LAFVAARLAGHTDATADGYFRELGIKITGRGARRAAEGHLYLSPHKRRRGRQSESMATAPSDELIREWWLVDEARLGLEKAVVRFPGEGNARVELRRRLERIAAVRQIVELEHDRELVAVVVFSGAEERVALQAQLSEIAEVRIWDDILYETHLPALSLWRERAYRAAAEEGLVSPAKASDATQPKRQIVS
jgi:hypothetical protein